MVRITEDFAGIGIRQYPGGAGVDQAAIIRRVSSERRCYHLPYCHLQQQSKNEFDVASSAADRQTGAYRMEQMPLMFLAASADVLILDRIELASRRGLYSSDGSGSRWIRNQDMLIRMKWEETGG